MSICKQEELCSGCGLCLAVCPKGCIRMERNSEGFFYPVIDEAQCVKCHKCETLCPVNDPLPLKNANRTQRCYAFQNGDGAVLQESSSGGFFTAAARQVLSAGGVVYAAEMPEIGKVRHVRIGTEAALAGARKSKYIQSEAWPVYQRIGDDLRAGRPVLFVGTPCQNAAVKRLYGAEPLFTCIDILCHGVSNEKVLQKYVDLVSARAGKSVSVLHFRHKMNVGGVIMYMQFDDGSEYTANSFDDVFMRAFNNNLSLRRSCYSCQFCGLDRVGDITMGDFWGLGVLKDSALSLSTGVSFIKVNSERGRALFDEVCRAGDDRVEEHALAEARLRNITLTRPESLPKGRETFFAGLDSADLGELVRSLSTDYEARRRRSDLRDRVLRKLRKILT